MGAFPNLPLNIPFCPRLSSLVLLGAGTGTKEDKRGQNGTFWDKMGNAPISIYPHLALLKGPGEFIFGSLHRM